VNRQRSHSVNTEMFNLQKLNEKRVRRNILLRFQIDLQRLNIWTLRWKLIVLWKKISENIKKTVDFYEVRKHKLRFNKACSEL
jgi:hypothetical protein